MPYAYTDSLEDIKVRVPGNEKFIAAFAVEDGNKIERLANYADSLDIFSRYRGKSCFVKPNIVSPEGYPTTTDLGVFGFVLKRLKEISSRIEAGDCSAAGSPLDHDLAKLASKLDVPFLDLKGGDEAMMGNVPIYTYPRQFDSIVSLPVLKEHFATGITFAVKNNFGFPAHRVRMTLHMRPWRLNQVIADLHGEYQVDLVIGDACRTMRRAQEKRWGGRQEPLGLFFLSNAPLELDLLAWKLMPKRKVKYLEIAKKKYGEGEVLVWIEPEARHHFES